VLPKVALDVIVQELEPFLKRLTEDERAEIPRAARRARNRRGWLQRAMRPKQPIEVVFVPVGKELYGGALFLRRRCMEKALAQANEEIQQSEQWPRIVSGAISTWLEFLPGDLERWLSRQAEYLPRKLHRSVFAYRDEESVLDLLEDLPPKRLGQALEEPLISSVVQKFIRSGDSEQRRRLRKILKAWSPEGRGRPPKDFDELRDILVAQDVEEAKARLAEGFRLRPRLHRPGTYDSAGALVQELHKNRYDEDEIDAIVKSNSLSEAAHRLIASRTARTLASVRVMASRGRKRLRAAG
jgi:hypothetical protein